MAASQINSDSKMDALEIEDEIADAIKDAGPNGLSYEDGCASVGLELRSLLSPCAAARSARQVESRAGKIWKPTPDFSSASGSAMQP
jgi:hypothetical protein